MYKIGKAQSILNKKTLSASPVQKVGEMPPSWLFASRSVVAKKQIYVEYLDIESALIHGFGLQS